MIIFFIQSGLEIPIRLQEHKYISHDELAVKTQRNWLKQGSDQGHTVT
jgi:hypothetical protein